MENNITCPISYEIMKNPVILVESGQTYDKINIEQWLGSNTTDPATGAKLKSATLIVNFTIRQYIESLGHVLENNINNNPETVFGSYSEKRKEYMECFSENIGYGRFEHTDEEKQINAQNIEIYRDILNSGDFDKLIKMREDGLA